MNSKKLECYADDDSVDEKLNLSFLGKWIIYREIKNAITNTNK